MYNIRPIVFYDALMLFLLWLKHDRMSSAAQYVLVLLICIGLTIARNKGWFNILKEPGELKDVRYSRAPGAVCNLILIAIPVMLFVTDGLCAEILTIAAGTTAILLCRYWYGRTTSAALRRLKVRKEMRSPYLSCIFLKNVQKNDVVSVLRKLESDETSGTKRILLSETDSGSWIISFPQGISLEQFIDIMLDFRLDLGERGTDDITGWFKSIDGIFDGNQTMITCDGENDFSFVDSAGTNYIVTYGRKTSFIPIEGNQSDYRHMDIQSAIETSRKVGQWKVDDCFDLM